MKERSKTYIKQHNVVFNILILYKPLQKIHSYSEVEQNTVSHRADKKRTAQNGS